jgi:hypothetical protein
MDFDAEEFIFEFVGVPCPKCGMCMGTHLPTRGAFVCPSTPPGPEWGVPLSRRKRERRRQLRRIRRSYRERTCGQSLN